METVYLSQYVIDWPEFADMESKMINKIIDGTVSAQDIKDEIRYFMDTHEEVPEGELCHCDICQRVLPLLTYFHSMILHSQIYEIGKPEKVLLLASYCGEEDECSDDHPCDECLRACNVAIIPPGTKIKVFGSISATHETDGK